MTTSRQWMYMPRDSYGNTREEFLIGVQTFLNWAFSERGTSVDGKIRCPCKRCKNKKYGDRNDVTGHIFRYDFVDSYRIWIYHGETTKDNGYEMQDIGESSNSGEEHIETQLEEMLQDLFPDVNMSGPPFNGSENPNSRAKEFYNMYASAQMPLFPGSSTTVLGFASGVLANRTSCRASEHLTSCFLQSAIDAAPDQCKDRIPSTFDDVKKIMTKLGLSMITYDLCEHHCFLYYKEGENLVSCPTCGTDRYKPRPNNKGAFVARKKIWYFPITERLQRMYMSRTTAEHMTWHSKCKPRSEKVIHPAGSIAWANFNETFPHFASEIRNVRLGLSTVSFDSKHSDRSYTSWPIFLTPYNLPPHLAMRPEFFFLSIFIPGPKSPDVSIDVMLRPLIDELLQLWEVGALTYDSFRKQNFIMRAALIWTISDLLTYPMLSGWSTHGKLACPCCMQNADSIQLKHDKKTSWFDCHRKFLPARHPERQNTYDYRKDRVVTDLFFERMADVQVAGQVNVLPIKIPFGAKYRPLPGKGTIHNWTKRSIFYELPYWIHLLIRHCLDVMHIEKNFFDNIKLTSFDEGTTSKDSLNARKDLKIWTNRFELFLEDERGKSKPKSTYTLTKEQQVAFCQWIKTLRFPDGHAGNIESDARADHTITGMKPHDCHVFMQRLLPIAFRSFVPETVWEVLTEVSNFFRVLCDSEISPITMEPLYYTAVQIVCKLEKIYPPSFFDLMEHLIVHLPFEAMMLGPVFYRWIYPFERMMWFLENDYINMKISMNQLDCSIVEAYLQRELSNLMTFYFGKHVQLPTPRVRRNDRPTSLPLFDGQLSICVPVGAPIGKGKQCRLDKVDYDAAILYIVMNCQEFDPYIKYFDSQHKGLDLEIRRVNHLVDWLRTSHRQRLITLEPRLALLIFGGSRRAISYKGYNCNWAKWHTYNHGLNRNTMCSGVHLNASGIDYFGMLTDIFEISFNAQGWMQQSVVLFKCEWYDHERGTRRHPKCGIVEINSQKRSMTRECFILASQATQVYYAPYPCSLLNQQKPPRHGWWVVCPTCPRHVIDESSMDWTDQEEEIEFFEDPAPPTVNVLFDDLSMFNVRHILVGNSTGPVINSDDDGE